MDENNKQLQKTFDKVAAHLLTQNQKAITVDGRCKYRTDDGLKCAVGCLIPDDVYGPLLEDKSILYLLTAYPELKDIPEINGFAMFLTELQHIHDNYRVEEWYSQLKSLAEEYELNTNVVNEYAPK